MKLLLNQAHISEGVWYDICLSHSKPTNIPEERVVFSGTWEGLELFNQQKKTFPKNFSAISNIVANDGSHITSILLRKDKKPAWQRSYRGDEYYPTCYRDYLKENSFPFKDDPMSSFKSAYEKIGSPLKFVVYLELIQRPNPTL